jgi:hypothetical protein
MARVRTALDAGPVENGLQSLDGIPCGQKNKTVEKTVSYRFPTQETHEHLLACDQLDSPAINLGIL